MSLHQKKKEESRKKILASAAALFRRQGYHATGVDSIMGKAGLTAGAFYAHFNSKSHLLEEVLRETLERNLQTLTIGLENKKGKEFVNAVFKRYLSEAHRDYPEKGCPLATLGPEITREKKLLDKSLTKTLNSYVETWVALMSPHLTGDKKERRRDALSLLSMMLGALVISRLTGQEISDEFLEI